MSTPAINISSTYALTLAYDGAAYSGFAAQKDPSVITVQETLETALATALRLPAVSTVCAGRTDAGVHALGQVISFTLPAPLADPTQTIRSLNALTPPTLVVRDLRFVASNFSARFDAVSREYRYRFYNHPQPPLFSAAYAWHIPQSLDLSAMQEAATALKGEHDFRSFCVTASADADKNTVRTIHSLDFFEEVFYGESLLTLRCIGNAFLHSMVRTIAGTLVEVGQHKRQSAEVSAILAAHTRTAAGQTAPAKGLTLYSVEYPSSF